MKISTALRRNVFEALSGRILNKFKFGRRRDVLLPEGILADYVELCEDAGYGGKLREISRRWIAMVFTNLLGEIPDKFVPIVFNSLVNRVWESLGYADRIRMSLNEGIVELESFNQWDVGIIGINNFSIGGYLGALNVLYGRELDFLGAEEENKVCKYFYEIKKSPFSVETKEKKEYERLNRGEVESSFGLKEALNRDVLKLENECFFFRKKRLAPVENSFFHLVSDWGGFIGEVPRVTRECLKGCVRKSSASGKLNLMKTLFQSMGWGNMIIRRSYGRVEVYVVNPPYGFQREEENWGFLVEMILGYLRLVDEEYIIVECERKNGELKIVFDID